jgi:hypothetical protein
LRALKPCRLKFFIGNSFDARAANAANELAARLNGIKNCYRRILLGFIEGSFLAITALPGRPDARQLARYPFGPCAVQIDQGRKLVSASTRCDRAVRVAVPSPLVGEGCSDSEHKLSWVRGLPPRVELIERGSPAERDPSPGTHLSMRSGLSHKGRGEAAIAAQPERIWSSASEAHLSRADKALGRLDFASLYPSYNSCRAGRR